MDSTTATALSPAIPLRASPTLTAKSNESPLQQRFLLALNAGTDSMPSKQLDAHMPRSDNEQHRFTSCGDGLAVRRSAGDDLSGQLPDMAATLPAGLPSGMPLVKSEPLPAATAPPLPANIELSALLERLCSAMYVSERSATSQRVFLALDHILSGAAAEILREGAHLTIRLHTRTEHSYRSMSLQREALLRALGGDAGEYVDVVVLRAGVSGGDG